MSGGPVEDRLLASQARGVVWCKPQCYAHEGAGIGINQQGWVALTALLDNGPDVLLLTPKSPAGNAGP